MRRRASWLSAPAGTMIVSAPLPPLFFLSFAKLSSWVPTFSRAFEEGDDGLEAIVLVARTAVDDNEEGRGEVVEIVGDDRRLFTELASLARALLPFRPATEQAGRVAHPAAIKGGILGCSRERGANRSSSKCESEKFFFFLPLSFSLPSSPSTFKQTTQRTLPER